MLPELTVNVNNSAPAYGLLLHTGLETIIMVLTEKIILTGKVRRSEKKCLFFAITLSFCLFSERELLFFEM
jgi:hypothetical protein